MRTLVVVSLIALAGCATLVKFNYDDQKNLPADAPSKLGFDVMNRHFPDNPTALQFIVVNSPHDLRAPKALADLEITESRMRLVQGLTTWTITLHNRSATSGYRSLVCETHYRDSAGALLHQGITEVWTLVQPGESVQTRVIDAVDWDSSVAQSDIVIRSAEPVVPLAREQAGRRSTGR